MCYSGQVSALEKKEGKLKKRTGKRVVGGAEVISATALPCYLFHLFRFPHSSYSTPPHFASQGRHCTEAFTSSLQPETAALGQSCATTHWKLTVLCDWGTAQTSLWTKTQWPTILFQRLLEEENPSANSQQKPPLMRALIACLKTSCWP